mgnify:CR=1 FL=1
MSGRGYRVIVPVQRLEAALPTMAVAPPLRARLALAFALDTIHAVTRCPRVSEVVVLTRDALVSGAMDDLGVRTVPPAHRSDVRSALIAAHNNLTEQRDPATAVLMGDLPALITDELSSALRRADEWHTSVFTEDILGGGTTFFANRRRGFAPCLGSRSAAANANGGSMRVGQDLPGIRCDVDNLEDLAMAKYLGVGPHTNKVLASSPILRSLSLTR